MTYQPSADDPYYPTVEPQPLKFEPGPAGGTEATFQAPVPGPGEPGAPAITLTVAVDPSVPRESADELNELLFGRLRGAFDVLPDLPPGWDVPGDSEPPSNDGDEPFDPKKHMKFGLSLVWPDEAPPVAVVVTVETAAGTVPAPSKAVILQALATKQNVDDYWYATNQNSPPTARVHVTGGHGTMRRAGAQHRTNVHIPPPDHFSLPYARAFILDAIGGAMGYTLNSGFYSPQHPNNQ